MLVLLFYHILIISTFFLIFSLPAQSVPKHTPTHFDQFICTQYQGQWFKQTVSPIQRGWAHSRSWNVALCEIFASCFWFIPYTSVLEGGTGVQTQTNSISLLCQINIVCVGKHNNFACTAATSSLLFTWAPFDFCNQYLNSRSPASSKNQRKVVESVRRPTFNGVVKLWWCICFANSARRLR